MAPSFDLWKVYMYAASDLHVLNCERKLYRKRRGKKEVSIYYVKAWVGSHISTIPLRKNDY